MVEKYLRCYRSYHGDDWDEALPAAEFLYNSAVTEDFGMSHFEMKIGWNPKSGLEFVNGYESSMESVDYLKKNQRESLNGAQYSYGITKAKQPADPIQNYKPPNCVIGLTYGLISCSTWMLNLSNLTSFNQEELTCFL